MVQSIIFIYSIITISLPFLFPTLYVQDTSIPVYANEINMSILGILTMLMLIIVCVCNKLYLYKFIHFYLKIKPSPVLDVLEQNWNGYFKNSLAYP